MRRERVQRRAEGRASSEHEARVTLEACGWSASGVRAQEALWIKRKRRGRNDIRPGQNERWRKGERRRHRQQRNMDLDAVLQRSGRLLRNPKNTLRRCAAQRGTTLRKRRDMGTTQRAVGSHRGCTGVSRAPGGTKHWAVRRTARSVQALPRRARRKRRHAKRHREEQTHPSAVVHERTFHNTFYYVCSKRKVPLHYHPADSGGIGLRARTGDQTVPERRRPAEKWAVRTPHCVEPTSLPKPGVSDWGEQSGRLFQRRRPGGEDGTIALLPFYKVKDETYTTYLSIPTHP